MQQCFLGVEVEMSFNRFRLEYSLEGNLNYIAWKDRMEVVLDDNGLNEFKSTWYALRNPHWHLNQCVVQTHAPVWS